MATATVPGYRVRSVPSRRPVTPACCQPKKGDAVEGTTHASTGFLLGAGIGLLTTTGHAHGVTVWEGIGRDLMLGAVTAGMALLPDSDHPQASFAYAAGRLSHFLSHVIAVVFGGHRQGMHSLFGIAVASLACASCADWWPNHWALGFLAGFLAICLSAGLTATGFVRRGSERLLVSCALAAAAVVYVRADLWWLVALGMALHIFEDEFSGHGCALFWPVYRHRIGGDGRQPAKSRKSGRRPKSGYQKAKSRAQRGPAAPKNPGRPQRQGPASMCLRCMVGECEDCKGQGCRCPQPATSHPKRPAARRTAAKPPELPETPPF